MRRSTFAAVLLVASTLMGSQVNAAAVKYYSRQVLYHGPVQTYTYTPQYGVFSTCSGGTQTATISSCTRNDGASVATSFCSDPTKTQSCASSLSCGSFNSGWWASPNRAADYSSTGVALASIPSTCVNYANQAGKAGFCGYIKSGSAYAVYYLIGSTATSQGLNGYYATTCQ